MRSRFTAFCLHKFKYLIDTLHPSKHQPNDLAELETSSHKTSWVKLTLQHTQQGLETDNQGSVEFSAIFNENSQFFELRETSSFIKENGQWFYLDGSPRKEISRVGVLAAKNLNTATLCYDKITLQV